MAKVTLPANYHPRSYQLELLKAWDNGCKRGAVVWHRRAGKDRTSLALTVKEAWRKPGVYWHLFPELNQGRKILWDGRDREGKPFLDAFPAAVIKRKLDQDMKIELHNGSIWQIVGSDNANSLVGTNPRGIVFSEWSLISPFTWDLVRPILRENQGWALFIYTPRGKNHAYRTFMMAKDDKSWFSSVKTIDDTRRDAKGEDNSRVITQEDIEQERSEGMAEEMIQQEYYCSFQGSMVGTYYGDQVANAEATGRIGLRPWEPKVPVLTAWDLGVRDACAVGCFQILGKEWRWIDYYENRGQGMIGAMKWLKLKPYIYAQLGHIGPHDIDTREISTAQSRKGFAWDHGFGFTSAPKLLVQEGIDMVRRTFPQFTFNLETCERLIDCLKSHRKEWDPKKEEFKKNPLEDWTIHAADMVRTAVVGYRKAPPKNLPTHATMEFDALRHDRPREAKIDWDPFSR